MLRSIKSTLAYAKIELIRSLRDPITSIVLFGIPVVLVLIFGSLMSNTANVSVRVAVVNESSQPFAKEFESALDGISTFKQPGEDLTLDEARQKMKEDSLDGVIELPKNFGEVANGAVRGSVKVYFDKSDFQTGDIVAGVMRSVVDETNKSITKTEDPITIERTPINVGTASAFDNLFAMFTGMAIMMVGVFAVSSVFPTAKKNRRTAKIARHAHKSSRGNIGNNDVLCRYWHDWRGPADWAGGGLV